MPSVRAEQLDLLGHRKPIRIPARRWHQWLTDPDVVARFDAKRFRRRGDQCWPWLGAVSSTGHGSFRAISLPGPSRRGTVPAHLFAYQLAYGVIARSGWSNVEDLVLCHQCDFAGCTNPTHLRLGTPAVNRAEYAARRGAHCGALADTRGQAGRTRAIAHTIAVGTAAGETTDTIDNRIAYAEAAGQPLTLW